jgi:hypothetical protein
MSLTKIGLTNLLIVFALSASGCGSSDTSSTTTSPSPTLTTDVLTGTVQPPVGGVPQSSLGTFVVSQANGSVQVTLTSAVETFPDGALLTTVVMGLGVGSVSDGNCVLLSGAFMTTPAGGSLSGTLPVGTYCVQVSDVTNQLGPVVYGVTVLHP